jgi:predicted phage baseplate assembly protein
VSTLPTPHTSSRRAALLEQLIVALTSGTGDTLPIRTRAPDDPTIALLDAWATVGDVLGFYLDRIADEGYLSTATEPGSILALAGLVGYQPVPSLAAQVYLAYTLAPDPADGAVQYSPGLLFQSVPGPGQQPQTFETAGTVVARPSWNLLTPKSGKPVQANTTSLVIDGTTTGLSPNDVILLAVAGPASSPPATVFVESASVNYSAKVTTVTLREPASASTATRERTAVTAPAAVTNAIDDLLTGGIRKAMTPVPESASRLPQTARSVFSSGSDAVPRLISTLEPAVGSMLYAALDTTPVGSSPVTGAWAMRVKAAPFGAAAPPQPVFNASGQPAGTRDWPIGDVFTLQLSVTATDFMTLLGNAGVFPATGDMAPAVEEGAPDAAINVQLTAGGSSGQATLDPARLPATASPQPAGFGAVTLHSGHRNVTLSYAGDPAPGDRTPPTPKLDVTASIDTKTAAVTLNVSVHSTADPGAAASQGTLIWDPLLGTPFSGQVADTLVTMTWTRDPVTGGTLTVSIATPLPLAERNVLLLDGNYPGITPGSYVVISSSAPAGAPPAIRYPVTTQVKSVDTVAARGYGITAKVTRLTLHDPWIDRGALSQSALRPLSVHAQLAALSLKPAPVTDDVTGPSIELSGLVAGVEPGRLIAVTGTRTDLPAGAAVQAGEMSMVASVTVGAADGDTPYSTLHLASPLSYSYRRATVQIYGNVVPAHQGATINQVLGSGQPAQAPQSFTLSSGPLLADPAPSGPGFASTLTVTVDGVRYAPAGRVDANTPARSYLAGTNASGQTTITFPAPLPAGSGNVKASYRAGDGSSGNLRPGQITQLLSRPAGLSSVTNPLAATGGSGGDDQESVRAAVPVSLRGLGRAVTIGDYAGLAYSISGVAKASAAFAPGTGVVVTVAGTDPVQLLPGAGLCSQVAAAIAAAAGTGPPVQVVPASLYLIALTAQVVRDPLVSWDATVAAARTALLASFGYAQRDLGRDVVVSDLLAAAHAAAGVLSVTITGLALIPATASAFALSTTLPDLLTAPVPPVATLAAVPAQWNLAPPAADAVAYLSAAAPGTLIFSEPSS